MSKKESGNIPGLKVDQTPRHQQAHKQRKRAHMLWERNRTTGFIRIHRPVEIDDRRIALKTNRNFFELKSFGATLHWSFDLDDIIIAWKKHDKVFLEEREIVPGRIETITVRQRHLRVFEYDPATSIKMDITQQFIEEHIS